MPYIVRDREDRGGTLYASVWKPSRCEDDGVWDFSGDKRIELPKNADDILLDCSVTWDDEPVKIEEQ